MNTSRIVIITLCLLFVIGATFFTSEAATSFNGSTIVGVDQVQRTITFQTREGQTWTLPLADPGLLKNEQVSKGDRVTIEIDLNDRVTKIIKLVDPSRSEHPQTLDDLKP